VEEEGTPVWILGERWGERGSPIGEEGEAGLYRRGNSREGARTFPLEGTGIMVRETSGLAPSQFSPGMRENRGSVRVLLILGKEPLWKGGGEEGFS